MAKALYNNYSRKEDVLMAGSGTSTGKARKAAKKTTGRGGRKATNRGGKRTR